MAPKVAGKPQLYSSVRMGRYFLVYFFTLILLNYRLTAPEAAELKVIITQVKKMSFFTY